MVVYIRGKGENNFFLWCLNLNDEGCLILRMLKSSNLLTKSEVKQLCEKQR